MAHPDDSIETAPAPAGTNPGPVPEAAPAKVLPPAARRALALADAATRVPGSGGLLSPFLPLERAQQVEAAATAERRERREEDEGGDGNGDDDDDGSFALAGGSSCCSSADAAAAAATEALLLARALASAGGGGGFGASSSPASRPLSLVADLAAEDLTATPASLRATLVSCARLGGSGGGLAGRGGGVAALPPLLLLLPSATLEGGGGGVGGSAAARPPPPPPPPLPRGTAAWAVSHAAAQGLHGIDGSSAARSLRRRVLRKMKQQRRE